MEPTRVDLPALKDRLHDRLVQQLQLAEVRQLPEASRRTELRAVVDRLVEASGVALELEQRVELVEDLLDEILGLGPLEKLLRDESISDILVNGPDDVYLERNGQLEEAGIRFRSADHLLQIIDRIVSRLGRRVDDASPMVDARLPDGSRVNAIVPPLALRGPALSIRKARAVPLEMEALMQRNAFTPEMAMLMEAAVRSKLNIVISGGTGSGKTTLLNVLSRFIGDRERIVTIEDAAELQMQQRHVVQLETRPPNVEGRSEITMRDLVRNALRMRPDRIVIGECRGPEAFDMLQAMNTGHEGSLTTIHSNAARDSLSRLETMLMMAGYDMPLKALRRNIASAVQLLIQIERLQGGVRRVTAMTEIIGMEGDMILLQDIFRFQQTGVSEDGKAVGQFMATGVRPGVAQRIEAAGYRLPTRLFAERVLLRV